MNEEEVKKRAQWEDAIDKFFEGTCRELDLTVLKFLRLRHPYQQTTLLELDRDIARERRKKE